MSAGFAASLLFDCGLITFVSFEEKRGIKRKGHNSLLMKIVFSCAPTMVQS